MRSSILREEEGFLAGEGTLCVVCVYLVRGCRTRNCVIRSTASDNSQWVDSIRRITGKDPSADFNLFSFKIITRQDYVRAKTRFCVSEDISHLVEHQVLTIIVKYFY